MFDPKAEKTIYFVRHGQSEDNIAPRFQGDDSRLTNTGREQAEAIADRAAQLTFEALISSPLPRTRDTAEAISRKTGAIPEFSDLLVEAIKPEGLAGKEYADPEANALWEKWYASEFDGSQRVLNGENFTDLIGRADKILDYLYSRSEKSLLVVTHGFILRTILLRVMLGDSLTPANYRNFQERVSMENTGVSVIQYNTTFEGASWRLWTYNDHSHLG